VRDNMGPKQPDDHNGGGLKEGGGEGKGGGERTYAAVRSGERLQRMRIYSDRRGPTGHTGRERRFELMGGHRGVQLHQKHSRQASPSMEIHVE